SITRGYFAVIIFLVPFDTCQLRRTRFRVYGIDLLLPSHVHEYPASLPTPLSAKSVTPSAAWPATAASNAFPPACKICLAASVAGALIEDTAAWRPRITGRIV